MKVILKQNVSALGKEGDVVTVSDGHARNFLIPRGLAAEATEGNVSALAREKKQAARHAEKVLQKAGEMAEKLTGSVCRIPRRVGEQDKLFGSVGARDIEAALHAQGMDIDRKAILLDDPIKALGRFPVKIKIHGGITAEITVEVVADLS
jgi:large subunit ribosomal protein L9